MRSPLPILAALLLGLLGACGGAGGEAPERKDTMPTPRQEPDHIVVDHILIGVRNAQFPEGKRTEAEARAFAYDLLAKVKAGEDWGAAKRANSEDPPPGGPYALANRGVTPSGRDEHPRDGMVPAFGDVGFSLEVGEVGMADFDARKSPFGFHLIQRVK